jgi:hypothetical protein
MNEEELKKGCGKETDYFNYIDCNDNEIFWKCGEEGEFIKVKVLCPTCQARLEGFQKGKLEERERISFQVKRLMVYIEKHWDNVPNPKKSVLYGLKQLKKEIGGGVSKE